LVNQVTLLVNEPIDSSKKISFESWRVSFQYFLPSFFIRLLAGVWPRHMVAVITMKLLSPDHGVIVGGCTGDGFALQLYLFVF
jgi:hypothetical protein